MFATPAQFSELQKSQLDALYALSQVAFSTTEKLVGLNLAAMKAAMDESAATTQSVLGIKDAQDILAVGSNIAQPALHKVVGYSRNYYSIVQNAQAEVRTVAENTLIEQAGGEAIDVDDVVARFRLLGTRLQPYVCDTVGLLHDALAAGVQILLEGAQATFLDLDHGTYPYVTSSNPTAGGACAGTGLGPRDIDRIVGITKAYTTRVGAGPFPTELTDHDGDTLVEVGREFGTVTGRRRRAGWLDCVMLRQAIRLNSLTELAMTKLDVLDGFETVKVCTGYRIDGELLTTYPDRADLLARVEPVYETMPGWRSDVSGARQPDALPAPAREFIELVETQVHVPVKVIGVGAERDDYLLWTA